MTEPDPDCGFYKHNPQKLIIQDDEEGVKSEEKEEAEEEEEEDGGEDSKKNINQDKLGKLALPYNDYLYTYSFIHVSNDLLFLVIYYFFCQSLLWFLFVFCLVSSY